MNRRLTRRNFLRGALVGTAAAGTFFYGDEAVGAVRGGIESAHAWQAAGMDNGPFLDEHGSVFDRVALGCSFEPEEWSRGEQAARVPLRALDYCVRGLGLREVRIAIRWDRVVSGGRPIDIRPYRPYLDYCFNAGLNLSLNLGPIRTFHWPEERVPGAVLASLPSVPRHGANIDWGDPLADAAMAYLHGLIDVLDKEYGSELSHLASIQPENESFQGFDRESWRVSPRYMTNVIKELDQRLPGVPILVTSAGRPALAAITNVFEDLIGHDDRFRDRLISGFDYYYSTPNHNRIPFHSYVDPIALAFHFPSAKTCEDNLRDSRNVGFRIEVSEAQAEPFAHITAPGNSARDFRFMLLRCAGKVLDPGRDSVLRIWGVEQLTKKIFAGDSTAEHAAICDMIRRLTDIPGQRA